MPAKGKYHLSLLLAALLLTCCASTEVLDSIVPSSGYVAHKDVAYGDHARQHLDIYVPEQLDAPPPVVLFFYGGGWQRGNKEEYRFVGQAFASKGYVAVVADYRLYPEVYFPAFVEDGADAFVWVHKHIAQYGGDPANIFLAGHSAGAYIAVMLTVNERYINAAGGKRSWIKGTAGLAGPYDFLPFKKDVIQEVFSKEKDELTQPITFVGRGVPPMLLLTGGDDKEVRPKNSINMVRKLQENDNQVALRHYPDVGHIGVVLALAHWFRGKAPVLEDIDAFIKENKTKSM